MLISKIQARELGKKLAPDPKQQGIPQAKIIRTLLGQSPLWEASHVGLYSAQNWEVDLTELFPKLGVKACFPRVLDETTMAYYPLKSLDERQPGYGGLLEPLASGQAIGFVAGDVLLVPGLAFDNNGGRVGSGKGFFDRFLQKLPPGIQKWGVCFESQVVKEPLEQQDNDIRMDALITEADFRSV